jgi:hypothetical protein
MHPGRYLIFFSLSLVFIHCGSDEPVRDKLSKNPDAGSSKTADADSKARASRDGTSPDSGDAARTDAEGETKAPAPEPAPQPPTNCDSLVPQRCALPWPSNAFMTESEKTDTGYWLTFGNQTFPKGAKGNRLKFPRFPVIDGYGLGSQIMAIFPNIDTAEIAGKYSVSKSIEDDAPIVLLEVRDDGTTRRVPYWAELDIKAKDSPKEQILFVRPAEILKDNTRYVVGFRDLETTSGEEITASDSFAKLRDENIEAGSRLSQRKSRFEEVFDILQDAGIDRDNLTLAWDFRTASSQYLHGRLRKLVQRGLNEVSSKGPKVIVEGTEVLDKSRSEHIALRIRGRFEVPKYTKKLDSVGWRLVRDHKGRILQNGTKEVDFIANVPRSALEEG